MVVQQTPLTVHGRDNERTADRDSTPIILSFRAGSSIVNSMFMFLAVLQANCRVKLLDCILTFDIACLYRHNREHSRELRATAKEKRKIIYL